jgi:hypothetical protein
VAAVGGLGELEARGVVQEPVEEAARQHDVVVHHEDPVGRVEVPPCEQRVEVLELAAPAEPRGGHRHVVAGGLELGARRREGRARPLHGEDEHALRRVARGARSPSVPGSPAPPQRRAVQQPVGHPGGTPAPAADGARRSGQEVLRGLRGRPQRLVDPPERVGRHHEPCGQR